ncbi:type VII secretion protein EccCa [Miniimonas arenae]|uniref:Type VII secretion protein EccCa n=1 Tax=Miniimonas arenae TaxID=676201 RepID=A0A5C5BEL5_9MICO|nr:type VII secretion protein EccCa [Miniimonas arenae]TNU76277.1 type VII secretion protein EccCa [Miniimonas arenae]
MDEESTRIPAPTVPEGTITLEPPPEIVRADSGSSVLMTAMPVVGSVGSIALIVFAQQPISPLRIMLGAGILIASLGFVAVNLVRQRSQHRSAVYASRREYLSYLADLRTSVRNAASRQRRNAQWRLPDPTALALLAEDGSRVWERAAADPDFLHARIGTGDAPLAVTLEPPETAPLAQLDPVAASAAHRFLLTHEVQHDVPTLVDLQQLTHLEVAGDGARSRALLRAMLVHLATFSGPGSLRLAVVTDGEHAADWEWVKWLPHAWSPDELDGGGPVRLVGTDAREVLDLLPTAGRRPFSPVADQVLPHVLLVLDGVPLPPDHGLVTGVQGATVVSIPRTWTADIGPHQARLLLRGAGEEWQAELLHGGYSAALVRPDAMSVADAEAAARRLTRRGLPSAEDERGSGEARSGELTDLLGLPDVRELDVATSWAPRTARDRLRVPFGVTSNGAPAVLDLKESAEGGMGPHGLIIGATGSGKSEVLRTLVLALTMTHSSEDLNLVLIDFKGGATFAGMSDLPHVSAVITNLSEELSLVDRMQEAIQGELTRRQELLRATGPFTNVAEYERARLAGRTDLAPLPTLLIVCDEFTEMLAAKPEFADLFAAIGRVGRSLRIHLLLSSQRLDEGRLRGLESHLSYRIGLRTFSASESRQVLGVPDAHTLPPVPGVGYLRPDPATLIRFRAAYVSAPPPSRGLAQGPARAVASADLAPFTAAPVPLPPGASSRRDAGSASGDGQSAEGQQPAADEPATFDIAVQRMAGRGPAAHQVWLPPLAEPATLDDLAPDLAVEPGLGLYSPGWRASGLLPLGITDLPLEQRREVFTISLDGAGGNLAVVGGPRSGKSTALRTVVGAIALTRTPVEAQIFVLDLGGGTFTSMRDLAHVAGVAVRGEEDVLRRTVAEVTTILDARERLFATAGIDSVETYRRRRTPGRTGPGAVDDGYGDVYLVVDGWSTLRTEYDDLTTQIQAIAGRGLTYGVHVLVSGTRWMDFRAAIKDLLGTRIELRLGETTDSVHRRRVADTVPTGRPGHGLTPAGRPMLLALPRLDGDSRPDTLSTGVEDLVESVTAAWDGPTPPKLRLLPERVTLTRVREMAGVADAAGAGADAGGAGTGAATAAADAGSPSGLLLGVDEATLRPVTLDLDEAPFAYLFGESDSGKSTFLRAMAREAQRTVTPKQGQIFVVDYRRALLGEVPPEYLAGYFTTAEQTTEQIAGLAQFLRTRLPGPDITPAQLRDRSWWTGALVTLLVDDYDLVATSTGNPLTPLVPLLPHARDIGLRILVTRRSGGAARAQFEPLLQTMRDLGATGILLSGDPGEGPLIGTVRARRAIPGRAQLVTRDAGVRVVQLADAPPSDL